MELGKKRYSENVLNRQALDKLPRINLHEARNWSKADVYMVQWPSYSTNFFVVKDFRRRPWWFRILVGRRFLLREWNALKVLQDIRGVPKPFARPDLDCIVMDYIDGKCLDSLSLWEVPDIAVDELNHLIRSVHMRGVAHGDLHRRNILIGSNGEISLIDWATAYIDNRVTKHNKHASDTITTASWLFRQWLLLDERAMAKIKYVFWPMDLTVREQELLLYGGSKMYTLAKKVRKVREVWAKPDLNRIEKRKRGRDRLERRIKKYRSIQTEDERIAKRALVDEKRRHLRAKAQQEASLNDGRQ